MENILLKNEYLAPIRVKMEKVVRPVAGVLYVGGQAIILAVRVNFD